jgi:rod shape-determining protein MreD
VIDIAGVRPNLILVAVVLVTALLGFGPGIVWAFVGGLTANLLVQDPLGTLPLALLLVSAMVAGGGRLLGRLTWVYPVLACFAGSVLADLIKLGVYRLVDDPLQVGVPLAQIIPAAFLNAAILALLLYPARVLTMRVLPEEKPAW